MTLSHVVRGSRRFEGTTYTTAQRRTFEGTTYTTAQRRTFEDRNSNK